MRRKLPSILLTTAIVMAMVMSSVSALRPTHAGEEKGSDVYFIGPDVNEVRFTESESAAPVLSSKTRDGLITVTVEIPTANVYHHGEYQSVVVPEHTNLLNAGYATVPTLLFRYVVPDGSTIADVTISNIEVAPIKNLNIARFIPECKRQQDDARRLGAA